MAALEASFSIFSFSSSPSPALSSSSKPSIFPKPTIVNLRIRNATFGISLGFPIFPVGDDSRRRRLVSVLCSVVDEKASPEGKTEKTQKPNLKRKLFVFNLPWSLTVKDISELFGQCGIVSDVEIIKQKDGRNRGFAFVTMATGEEAQAAVDKFDSYQVSGRILRVNFARRFKKPSPRMSTTLPASKETCHKLYASNLAWKARSTHLRELFSAADLNPVSARVVFETPEGRAAGYGFVSFATREEAETAISKLNGKELMGRPISLKFSARKKDVSEDQDEAKNELSEGKSE